MKTGDIKNKKFTTTKLPSAKQVDFILRLKCLTSNPKVLLKMKTIRQSK
jgi:hypothetical protein